MACVLGSMQCSTSNSCGRGGLTVRACFMKNDHYSILGVRKNASKTEIKTAYRRLARRYHPDVCKDRESEQKFKQIHTAYETIINNQSCLQHEVCLDSSLEALFQTPISEVVPDIFYSNDWFEGLDFNNPTYPHSPMAHGSMEGEGFFEEIEKEQYKKAEDFAPWMAY